MLSKTDVKTLLEGFLENDLMARVGAETVVLCGSHATGRATAHSDIDLCYIGNFPAFKREVIIYENIEFQLMIASWSWYNDVITNYERKEENGGTITVMLAHGICIYGENAKWANLSETAMKYFSLGPCKASERTIRSIRLRITGLFDNYSDQPVNSLNQKWLSFHLIECCIESEFKIKNWWTVKPKYELDELLQKDPIMSGLVEECLLSRNSGRESIKKLCLYVLEPVGGFLRESMLIHDEAMSK